MFCGHPNSVTMTSVYFFATCVERFFAVVLVLGAAVRLLLDAAVLRPGAAAFLDAAAVRVLADFFPDTWGKNSTKDSPALGFVLASS